jgi:uncharacterized repeat protein (TIGR01451 family)
MKINKLVLGASLAVIITASSFTYSAFAWHPSGVIVKKVQNVTTGSALSDADSAGTAVAAKPGDTLKYVITVSNNGASDSKGLNDMAKTIMTDTLPAGIELASNPAQRTLTENMGLIKPGKSVTKEYLVKVTAKTDGAITNTACFTGDSTVNDNPQKGCNPAVVTVTVPPVVPPTTTPETPVVTTPETPAPEAPVVPAAPVELPHTGIAENIIGSILAIGAATYAIYSYAQSRRELQTAFKTQR